MMSRVVWRRAAAAVRVRVCRPTGAHQSAQRPAPLSGSFLTARSLCSTAAGEKPVGATAGRGDTGNGSSADDDSTARATDGAGDSVADGTVAGTRSAADAETNADGASAGAGADADASGGSAADGSKRGLLDRQAEFFIPKDESEARRVERKGKLAAELGRTIVADMRDYAASGGKAFKALGALIGRKKAEPFPAMDQAALAGTLAGDPVALDAAQFKGKATLVLCSFRYAESLSMAQSWGAAFDRSGLAAGGAGGDGGAGEAGGAGGAGGNGVQLFEVSFMGEGYVSWFSSIFTHFLRNAVPAERHGRFLVHFGDSREYETALGMSNRLLGYAFLVDSKGLVRWKGSGEASPSEVEAMLSCTEELAQRQNTATANAAAAAAAAPAGGNAGSSAD